MRKNESLASRGLYAYEEFSKQSGQEAMLFKRRLYFDGEKARQIGV